MNKIRKEERGNKLRNTSALLHRHVRKKVGKQELPVNQSEVFLGSFLILFNLPLQNFLLDIQNYVEMESTEVCVHENRNKRIVPTN